VATSDLLRLQRGAEHLHRLGPRVVGEFLLELADAQTVLELLDAYRRRITPQMVLAAGGDRFPRHLSEVPR
jgi:hypothetical protein